MEQKIKVGYQSVERGTFWSHRVRKKTNRETATLTEDNDIKSLCYEKKEKIDSNSNTTDVQTGLEYLKKK